MRAEPSGTGAPVDDRTRTDDERAVVPGCVEEYARVAAEDRAALALARHEGDPESGCLPEQRPEQGAAEVVEVHPVALAGESRELPGAVQRGELQEPGVLFGRDAEPVHRVGERAPGELPADPVAGGAAGHRADAEPDAAGTGRQRPAGGARAREASAAGTASRNSNCRPMGGALRGDRPVVVTGEAGEVEPPVRGRRWGEGSRCSGFGGEGTRVDGEERGGDVLAVAAEGAGTRAADGADELAAGDGGLDAELVGVVGGAGDGRSR